MILDLAALLYGGVGRDFCRASPSWSSGGEEERRGWLGFWERGGRCHLPSHLYVGGGVRRAFPFESLGQWSKGNGERVDTFHDCCRPLGYPLGLAGWANVGYVSLAPLEICEQHIHKYYCPENQR
jgi:hypothetical protein